MADIRSHGRWDGRVQFRTNGHGQTYAYRPNQVVTERAAVDYLRSKFGDGAGVRFEPIAPRRRAVDGRAKSGDEQEAASNDTRGARPIERVAVDPPPVDSLPPGALVRAIGVPNPLALTAELRAGGLRAQANHVLFAHSASGYSGGAPNPGSTPWPGGGCCESPCGSATEQSSAAQFSTARPCLPPTSAQMSHRKAIPGATCRVLVVDTGALTTIADAAAVAPPVRNSAADDAVELLDDCVVAADAEGWDEDGNGVLDPFAGHGTFIAGLIANLAPGAEITVIDALSSFGDTDDSDIAERLLEMFDLSDDGSDPPFDVVSLSFGGFCENDDPPIAIQDAIARIQEHYRAPGADSADLIRERVVFVASAGNSGSCRPTWPASFENVIAVGALGPDGPAWFTNWGPWVDACAPGIDVVSCFFDLGALAGPDEHFDGWASWSGTSFSAPIVAASIAWEWMGRGGRELVSDEPTDAGSGRPGHSAAWLLDRPGLYRYPHLGTVVNPF